MYKEHEVSDLNPTLLNSSGMYNTSYLNAVPALIKIMKEEKSWKKGDLNTMVLLRDLNKKIILAVLHEKTEIKYFQSDDSVTFHVLEGKLQLHIRGGSVTVNSGEVLTMNEKTKYSFDTPEETAFLMTLARGNPIID